MANIDDASKAYALAAERSQRASNEVRSLQNALKDAQLEDSEAYQALRYAEETLHSAAVEEHSK